MASLKKIEFLKEKSALALSWDSGASQVLPLNFLRAASPSAENTYYSEEYLDLTHLRKNADRYTGISLKAIEPVGNYAVRLRFNDGHNTGIYSFSHFEKIARIYEKNFQTESTKLEA